MTRFAMSILAVEAVEAVEAGGAGFAALLPTSGHGFWPTLIITVYGLSLAPTVVCARKARVTPARPEKRRLPLPLGLLAGGAAIGLLAYGPALLSVALATELHGRSSVAYAAVSFSAGCLLSSMAVDTVARSRLPATLAWPMWGIVMLFGWIAARSGRRPEPGRAASRGSAGARCTAHDALEREEVQCPRCDVSPEGQDWPIGVSSGPKVEVSRVSARVSHASFLSDRWQGGGSEMGSHATRPVNQPVTTSKWAGPT
jgi:hypothetical protein